MPTYEFRCRKCGKSFEVKMTIGDHGRKSVVCPKCTSKDVEQKISRFSPITSKKS